LKRGNENPRFLPTVRNTKREFALLARDRKPDDSMLVALSGHGITRTVKLRDPDGREHPKPVPFFCPIDADIDDPESLVSIDALYAELEASKAGVKVMLVDACRNDPTEGRTAAIPFRSEPPPPSVAALFACSNGEVAWDANDLGGGHGVFFHYVIEGLRSEADLDHNRQITLAELTAYVQDKVPDYVSFHRGKRQMPLLLNNGGRITLLDLSRGIAAPEFLIGRVGGIRLKRIPAGEFLMGSSKDEDKDASDDELPRHRVRITRPFYLGVTEVTVGQFRRVVESASYRTEAERDGKGGYGWNEQAKKFEGRDPKYNWKFTGFEQTDDHPVVNVTWNDAIAFCNKLSEQEGLKPYYGFGAGEKSGGDGYRLPTEAEWEYACRAGTTTRYQSGDDAETLATVGNVADGTLKAKGGMFSSWTAIAARDSYVFTAPVGRFRANAFGLYDMHGNVWEWCWDGYKADYYKESPEADPSGPLQASGRVIRGGSWYVIPRVCRSAYRVRSSPDRRDNDLGFRLARVQSAIK
jgi:formylglycine-generating enzyme required for sulfatase activity